MMVPGTTLGESLLLPVKSLSDNNDSHIKAVRSKALSWVFYPLRSINNVIISILQMKKMRTKWVLLKVK